ncbi:hypothetical protein [Sphingomonas sp. CROZ-RG-20F-R02-07]|uniref:hypothetical protein n=1 Tax=Sphingomonas sp. CROZ-RG-20F-R02-07 TaxID=2914832 RepID=UPI001F5993F3|nr:hypothetical protein [Sphingomonas sp. CROZ-RG-20F-R02-07]
MRDRGQTLARLHRVRTIQLNLARADEARAHDKAATEAALGARIAELADAIAPAPQAMAGFSLGAAAHYREKLQISADAAQARARSAMVRAEAATETARSAWRDQAAMEKLIARADADAVRRAMKELEAAPSTTRTRHDPCEP